MEPLQVFISYARKDEKYVKEFLEHLKSLQRSSHISVWYDRHILSGSNWRETLDLKLETADLFLLIISPSFISSKFINENELPRAMQRYEERKAVVLPIIFRPVNWGDEDFAKLQVLPKDAKPVTLWNNRDEAYLDIINRIKKVVNDFHKINSNGSDHNKNQAKVETLEELAVKTEFIFDKRAATYINKVLQQIEASQSKNKQDGIQWLQDILSNPPNVEPIDNWLYICLEFHLRFLGEEIMQGFPIPDNGKPTPSFSEYFFRETAGRISGWPLVLGQYFPINKDTKIALSEVEDIVSYLDQIEMETQQVKAFIELYTSLSYFVPDERLIDEVLEKTDDLREIYLNLDVRILKCGGSWKIVHRELVKIFDDLCYVLGSFNTWLLDRSDQAKFSESYF